MRVRPGTGLPGHGMSRRQQEEVVRARRLRQGVFTLMFLAVVLPVSVYLFGLGASDMDAPFGTDPTGPFDAVVVPGGGITPEGDATVWVRARLDKALELFETNPNAYFVLLSRGTPHKPPPMDMDNRPIDEAYVSAEYMRERGVPSERLLQDTWSLDTIGNALFLRLMHLEPRKLKRVAVITNTFHMNRVRAIFEWVLHAPPTGVKFKCTYISVPDVGLTEEQLRARMSKEAASLEKMRTSTLRTVQTLPELHAFIFERHGAYATGIPRVPVSKELAASY
mmetsp:Transcript_14023/g.41261  ORF Transcript_14023/g.41261 Transcript_14023/m.41261 type:complete len:280 (+) Transcript_14023:26-865(+)